ncbi:hypothetical protein EMCRGX_G015815 [Ephydatia muelleri]
MSQQQRMDCITRIHLKVLGDKDVNTLVPIPSTGASFTGLTNITDYTVSVVAFNCAGSSSPATITVLALKWHIGLPRLLITAESSLTPPISANRAHLQSEPTSHQSPPPSEPTSHQSPPPIRAHPHQSPPPIRAHLPSEPTPIRAHLPSEPTSHQSPPPIRAHLPSEVTSHQSPPPIRAHLHQSPPPIRAPTTHQSPPPIRAHLPSEPNSNQSPLPIRAHLQSEPTPHVAAAGCQWSLWWLGLHLSADVLMTGWDRGKPGALEIIVKSPLTPAILDGSWQMAGASSPTSRKLQSNGPSWTFIPLTVETYCNWGMRP